MDYLQHHLAHIFDALRTFEVTPWKAVGICGSLLFASRWFVQFHYTRKLKRVVMPLAFWWLSVGGSALMLAYFVFGKNDSVGIISTAFPAFVSLYNLIIHIRHQKNHATGDTVA